MSRSYPYRPVLDRKGSSYSETNLHISGSLSRRSSYHGGELGDDGSLEKLSPRSSRFTNRELEESLSRRPSPCPTEPEVRRVTFESEADLVRNRVGQAFEESNDIDLDDGPEIIVTDYGEEPTSILDDVSMFDFEQLFDRQKVPEIVARGRVRPEDMSQGDLNLRLEYMNDVHEPSRIRDGLYETACHYLSGKGNKEKHYPKIGYVLSLISFHSKDAHLYDKLEPADPEEFPEGTRLLLDVQDSTKTNLMELFPIIISFIVHALSSGGTHSNRTRGLLIHCRKGMSRSVAAIIAYLVWAENKPVIEIFRDIVAARAVAWPNEEFYTQLCMWRMWNCQLTEGGESPKGQYVEYIVEKGLSSAVVGVEADLTAHLGWKPPGRWPVGGLR